MDIVNELLQFIKASASPFHSVESIKAVLKENKFCELKEAEKWDLVSGKYYVTRNDSSIIAFDIPKEIKDYHFQISASHSDSPSYKLKANPVLKGPKDYLRLDTEGYGGMIDYTWLDKPLSIAGRVYVQKDGKIEGKLVNINKDLLIIPSLAIHQNPGVNKGFEFNKAVDLVPLFSAGELNEESFLEMLSDEIKEKKESILSWDLYLVNRQESKVWGFKDEFISSPKLDDLEAAFASLKAFVSSKNPGSINVFACFDNEEVGSSTKQGAMSTFLKDTLNRINCSLKKSSEEYQAAIAKSFLVSFDNAHALHPNHPEKSDATNSPLLNQGIVIKENAAQHYTTDALSRAVFKSICKKNNIPVQLFANRSDMAGGGTLGNISNVQVSLNAVDIGIAQLAMHSSYETAGTKDVKYAVDALKAYYESLIVINSAREIDC